MKSILKISCLSAVSIAALASCQKEMTPTVAPEQPSAKSYTLTVDATKGDDVKALSLDGQALNVKWAATDQVSVFPESWATPAMGTLTAAASETGSTTLTGAVTGAAEGNTLNFLFPRAEWNYTGQKGILLSDENSIEKKYDYAAAQVTVSEVDGTTITTNTANFTSQQAIVKFRLTDGVSPVAVNSLTISANSGKLVTNKSYRGLEPKTYYSGDGYYTVDAGSGGFNDDEVHNKLVDNKLNTKWCQNKPDGGWYIEFHTASAIQVDGYMLRTGNDTRGQSNRNPTDWVLKAKKNSGDSWTVIDTKVNNNDLPNENNTETYFDVATPGEYRYFRLEISNNRGNGGAMQLSEMRLFKYAGFGQGTSYGNITVTPGAAASELTVALRNENAGADKYTLTAYVDGGGKYTFTNENSVLFENGKYYDIRVPMNATKVSSISLNKSSFFLIVGGTTETLSVTYVSPSDAVDKTVTWSSDDTSVATVDAATGVVTAVAAGTTTIKATAHDGGGTFKSCTVSVYPAGAIVWSEGNYGEERSYSGSTPYTNSGISVTMSGNSVFGVNYWGSAQMVCSSYGDKGNFVFSNSLGKSFKTIVINPEYRYAWSSATFGTGWTYEEGDYMTGTGCKLTWSGNAATVPLFNEPSYLEQETVKSFIFILE